ncbi:MAG: arylamine N-acetyltransferase [Sulfitobacter sp.]|uniref:arylamine N-acetyltransferase family protein n=1 Tax=Antarcticimicrobium sp. TaxID=2824147 RepID=UPI00262E572D|nr:arylamine N-acetyltransferase [Antarcticimicrobium sp.]MDF1716755.1 arylamine N-acetyltransferase [Antarcticimicrobium sp.]MDF1729102.1 arylamine N-acetyltransferase [Sulfitobacter sp.]
MTGFDLTAYLDHLGLDRVPITAQGLRELQVAQLRAIPFEAIDPYLGCLPALDVATICDKVLHRGRGGYCFELNALLYSALMALGFDARQRLARVRKGAPEGGPRSHLMIEVTLPEGGFLADAGYGGPGALIPLRLDSAEEQVAPNGSYRLWHDERTGERVVDKRTGAGWFSLYGFDNAHVGKADIEAANFICAHWDTMPFSGHLMLAGFDGDTRIGVFDRAVTREGPAGAKKSMIADFEALSRLLTEELHLRLDAPTLRRIWNRLAQQA